MSRYTNTDSLFLEPKIEQYGSHMVMSNVHKPIRTKFVNIDTIFSEEMKNDSSLYTNSVKHTIILPENINDVKSMKVISAEIPRSYYNISESLKNNTFIVHANNSENKISVVISISDGDYTNLTIESAINTAIIDAGITDLTYSVSGTNSKFESKNSYGHTLIFDNIVTGLSQNINSNSKLGWILGFRKLSYIIKNTTTLSSESFIDLNTIKYIFLVIDEFTNGFVNSMTSPVNDSMINKRIIGRIGVDMRLYPLGSIIFTSVKSGNLVSDTRTYSGKVDFRKLSVQLVNCFGEPINLNGVGFSFILKIDYE